MLLKMFVCSFRRFHDFKFDRLLFLFGWIFFLLWAWGYFKDVLKDGLRQIYDKLGFYKIKVYCTIPLSVISVKSMPVTYYV